MSIVHRVEVVIFLKISSMYYFYRRKNMAPPSFLANIMEASRNINGNVPHTAGESSTSAPTPTPTPAATAGSSTVLSTSTSGPQSIENDSECLPKYRRDLVAKQKILRAELNLLQPQSGHCRFEVSRSEIFEVRMRC